MTWKTFLIQLALVSVLLVAVLIGMGGSPRLAPYIDIGWITWFVFLAITFLLFIFGSKTSNSHNKHAFLQLVILSMVGKMILAFFIAILYYQFTLPTDKLFVLPLFTMYFGFTIFETYLMMKLGKQNV